MGSRVGRELLHGRGGELFNNELLDSREFFNPIQLYLKIKDLIYMPLPYIIKFLVGSGPLIP